MAHDADEGSAPVFQGMVDPPMYRGVPLLFFAADVLGSLFAALCLVQVEPIYSALALLVGAGIYGVMALGTLYDARWWGIVWAWLSYASQYEA